LLTAHVSNVSLQLHLATALDELHAAEEAEDAEDDELTPEGHF
jgi:hypothetical protein